MSGRERVAAFVLGVLEKFAGDAESVPVSVNGEPGILAVRDGAPLACWTVDIGPEGVRRLLIVLNQQKLERIGRAALSHS